jgi:hypothetical protein
MSIDLEYAIKQDVRNNPVVREVDRAQKREFLHTLGWAGAAVALAVFALAPQKSLSTSGYRLEQAKEALDRERAAQREYQLELEMLLRPQDLGPRAANQLRMVGPGEGPTLVIERVPATPPASRAIVAAAR